jgi:hypothetical protein
MIPFNLTPDHGIVGVEKITVTYTQQSDSNTDEQQTLTIVTDDAGGGMYLSISTERWSIDNVTDLVNLIQDFLKRAGADA